ncbi:uncharacterized protein PRCAT00002417001 [Priceomyces carsonii]|uniref:uncharacterized protein n=1 Tax=Priceomyces carsonii TaxID=28549 RepID=UPI002ED96779|nr:unnamed protein product [Priceomyces carsonii]
MSSDSRCTQKLKKLKLQKLLSTLDKYRSIVKSSKLFEETIQCIGEATNIKSIWCLALGSPSESMEALYQLAYVEEIGNYFNLTATSLWFYDPIFNDIDKDMLVSQRDHQIKAEGDFHIDKVLLFLPHASLELTNHILEKYRPQLFLGNDLISHTDRLTKKRIFEQYPLLATLIQIVDYKMEKKIQENEFTTVVNTKKKKNRKNRGVYHESNIDYDFELCYAAKVEITRYMNTQGEWQNAFSDLAFHLIIPKEH